MSLTIETRYGPAELRVLAHGGVSVIYKSPIIINRVEYRSVQAWHEERYGRLSAEVSGYRGRMEDLTASARQALKEELERLREQYASPAALQSARREVLEARVDRAAKEARDAEAKWQAALADLEAASAALAEHPALDGAA